MVEMRLTLSSPRRANLRLSKACIGESASEPRHLALVGFFKGLDLIGKAQREGDLIGSSEEAFLAKGVDLKGIRDPIGARHALLFEVDADVHAWSLLQGADQGLYRLGRQFNGQQAVLH